MADLQAKVQELTKTIEDKDEHIKKQTDDIVNLRKKADGTSGTNEELAKRLQTLEEQNNNSLKNLALERASGGDPEKRAKIEKELDSVVGSPTDLNGWTEKIGKAASIAGITPAQVNSHINTGSQSSGNPNGQDFADTADGKSLATQLNLKQAQPVADPNKK